MIIALLIYALNKERSFTVTKAIVLKSVGLLIAMAATFTLVIFLACGGEKTEEESKSIMIKGSDTMVHLVSSWAEAYMNKWADLEISVTGGGSGTGIAALINGTTDICAASRNMKPKEIKLAEEKGTALIPTGIRSAARMNRSECFRENPVPEPMSSSRNMSSRKRIIPPAHA
jgi:ABC-type phosphate transport system substrate-binding protein